MPIDKVVGQINGQPPLYYRSNLDCWQRMRPWDLSIPTMAAHADDDRVRLGTIKDAWCSGVKVTYTLTTETGRSIRATDEHPFLLENGEWLELGALSPGMQVRVNVGQGGTERAAKLQYHQTDTCLHPFQVKNNRNRWKVATHRLVVEAAMNGISFDEFLSILRIDARRALALRYLLPGEFVHHRDEDTFNNSIDNLEVVKGQKGHSEYHNWGANVLARIGSEKIVSIEEYGEEPTYDIEMVDDPHCFLANGFVVHNTGKTTTILRAIDFAPEEAILVCAFNKRIEVELTKRLKNPNALAKTLHALGYKAIQGVWERISVEKQSGSRAMGLTVAVCPSATPDAVLRLVTKLHTKGREMAPHAKSIGDLTDIAMKFECDPEEQWIKAGYDLAFVETKALEAMELAAIKRPQDIDFADMIFLPLRNGWLRPTYDLVVVDECQDLSFSQLELAQGLCKGRFCLVGDPNQAIYDFRGADSTGFDRLKTELNAEELGLTVTYRCGKAIVADAQRLVPDFTAGADNPEGEIRFLTYDKLGGEIANGDFLLSRTNAPLVKTAMALLRQQKRARIAGRDIGQGLKAIMRRINTTNSVPELLKKLDAWQAREIERAVASKRPQRVEVIQDQAETIRVITDGATGVKEVEARIDALFTDDGLGDASVITCSSVHRAKGLEALRVYVLIDTLYPGCGPNAIKGKKVTSARLQEEQNIHYVALTRAKQTLVKVRGMK